MFAARMRVLVGEQQRPAVRGSGGGQRIDALACYYCGLQQNSNPKSVQADQNEVLKRNHQ